MWPSDFKRYLATKESVYWTWSEVAYCLNEMEQTPEDDRLPLDEQTWADICLSVVKTSELSWLISDMPSEFWVFIIMLALQLLYIANLLVDVWIDFMVEYLHPAFVHIVLLPVCVISWPSFFMVINLAITKANDDVEEHQRTVLFRGVPEKSCNDDRIQKFLEDYDWRESVTLRKPRKGKMMWELTFESKKAMKRAFTEAGAKPALGSKIDIDNEVVHISLKLGRSTSSVQWWMKCFQCLQKDVPRHFWLRATLSCFVTLSLAARYSKGVGELYKYLDYNWLDGVFTCACVMSLLFWFFYVGWHAYGDARDARKAIEQAGRARSSSDTAGT